MALEEEDNGSASGKRSKKVKKPQYMQLGAKSRQKKLQSLGFQATAPKRLIGVWEVAQSMKSLAM